MKKYLIPIIVIIIIIILVVVFYKPASKETIKIGVTGPFSGDAVVYGESIKEGINLALEEINNKGGIKDKKIKLIVEDNRCDPKESTSAITKLINTDKVKIIITEACSSAMMSEAPIAERSKVILLGATASNPKIKDAGDYIFRIYPSDTFYGNGVAHFMKGEYQKVAVFYINNDWGEGIANVFKDEFGKLGGEVVIVESINEGATDGRTQLTKIKAKNPEAIFVPIYLKELAIVAKQAKELGITLQFVSAEPVEDFINLVGESAEGFIFASLKQNTDTYYQDFKAKYINKYGKEPKGYAIDYGYDALKLFAKPLEICGENPKCIKEELYKIHEYRGASGLINFDEYGEVIEKKLSYQQVKNGQFVPYEE